MPSKVSQFISFAEKGTNVVHSEDQLAGYSTSTGVEGDRGIQSVVPRAETMGLYRLGVPYG